MSFMYQKNILHVEDVPCPEIAKAVQTPVYVYSASILRQNATRFLDTLKAGLPEGRVPSVHFAVKACSNIHILRLLQGLGVGADVVSGGELLRAYRAGMTPGQIVFSGVGKTDSEIEEALGTGIKQINVESIPELARISALSQKLRKTVPLVLRVNPDVDARTHAKTTTGLKENKFGINLDQVGGVFAAARDLPMVDLRGLSVHIGSQITDFSTFRESFQKIAQLVTDLRAAGFSISRLDLGGGIGIRYNDETLPDLADYVTLLRETIVPLGTEMLLEPGRTLVGNAGILLSRVIFEKHGTSKSFLIIDAAMNDLMRPALYESYHGVDAVVQNPQAPQTLYDIVGPVCETGDTLAWERNLPQLSSSDLIALRDAGAYGAVMSSTYNTRPLAPEVLVDGSKFRVIRKRWQVEDLLMLEE